MTRQNSKRLSLILGGLKQHLIRCHKGLKFILSVPGNLPLYYLWCDIKLQEMFLNLFQYYFWRIGQCTISWLWLCNSVSWVDEIYRFQTISGNIILSNSFKNEYVFEQIGSWSRLGQNWQGAHLPICYCCALIDDSLLFSLPTGQGHLFWTWLLTEPFSTYSIHGRYFEKTVGE